MRTTARWRLFGAISILNLLTLLAAALLAASCSKDKEAAFAPGSMVLALGDSLTAGAGVTPGEAWPNLLANRTGWQVVNGGISGDTSRAALQRLPALLEEHHPVLVLVALGGNDMLRQIPQQETVANLAKTIALIKVQGAKPVLLATPKPSAMGAAFRSLAAADFYRDVADREHVPLIEDALAEVLSDPQMKGDPLHPNAAGHALLAGKIFDTLKEIGYAR